MAQQNTKKIGRRPVNARVSNADMPYHIWTVMRPFVHFSIKTMRVIAHTLIFIVKNIPKPEGRKPAENNNNKVTRI